MVDLNTLELDDPIEVWEAVEGEQANLIALLRSDKRLTPRTRSALADWLEGGLTPVERGRGRPKKDTMRELHLRVLVSAFGYDISRPIGLACYRLNRARAYIRKRGWHLKRRGRPYFPISKLTERVAKRTGVDERALRDAARRKEKVKPRQSQSMAEYEMQRRTEIALEIRRKKIRENA